MALSSRVRSGRLVAGVFAAWIGCFGALCGSGGTGLARPMRVQTARFRVHGLFGRENAIAIWTDHRRKPGERLPLVIAFHGMGESKAGVDKGYKAWVDRYGLVEAYDALLGGPVAKQALGGLVRDGELSSLNAALEARPIEGVLVVGVYTPDLLPVGEREPQISRYAAWVANKLVPKIRRMFPIASEGVRSAGVDGVSLGGAVALEVGFRHPEVFGSVGAMQPAVRGYTEQVAELAAAAHRAAPQRVRLLSSDRDPLLDTTRSLSAALRARKIPHTLRVTPGGHDYAFNQGPGAVDLVRFHDRALRDIPVSIAPPTAGAEGGEVSQK